MATQTPERMQTVKPSNGFAKKLGIAAVSVAGATAAWMALRHWHTHWGATAEESRGSLPGDELVPGANINITHAITIDAPCDSVWPWLAQMGQDKGGFY